MAENTIFQIIECTGKDKADTTPEADDSVLRCSYKLPIEPKEDRDSLVALLRMCADRIEASGE